MPLVDRDLDQLYTTHRRSSPSERDARDRIFSQRDPCREGRFHNTHHCSSARESGHEPCAISPRVLNKHGRECYLPTQPNNKLTSPLPRRTRALRWHSTASPTAGVRHSSQGLNSRLSSWTHHSPSPAQWQASLPSAPCLSPDGRNSGTTTSPTRMVINMASILLDIVCEAYNLHL